MLNELTEHLDLLTTTRTNRSTSGRGRGNKLELTGIKKLRELILDLAVRGKLVPQNPDDEPVSVLLEKVAAEKARLVKGGKIKKQKSLPAISDEEKLFELPVGWEWERLGSITNYGMCDKAEAADVGLDTWILELEDVEKTTSKLLSRVCFKDRQFKSSKNKFDVGDVIYGKLRPYLDKVLIADESGVCTTEMIPLHAYAGVSSTFLRLVMKTPYFIAYATESTHGMNLPRMGTDKARSALIPIATENQQHRIVTKVSELMTLCDQLEQEETDSITAHQTLVDIMLTTLTDSKDSAELAENWAMVAEHFDTLFTTEQSIARLRQTILQLAVMGRLVAQNPDDEPAAKLLKRVATEKARLAKEGKIKKQKLLPPISNEGKPFELPQGWKWVNLQQLITLMDAGWSPACPPETSPNDDTWGVLKTTAVQTLEYRENENKVLAETKDPRPQYEVKVGDILITRAGPKNRVGISCLVEITRPKLMISDKIIRFHLVEMGMSERYISLCLNAGATAEHLESAKSGMAESQMNISQDKLQSAPIPLCPANEQHQIVTRVTNLMTLCDILQQQLQQAQTTQQQLASALVEQAIATHNQPNESRKVA